MPIQLAIDMQRDTSEDPGELGSAPRVKAPVKVIGFRGSDAELLERLHRDGDGAAGLLHDRFSGEVNGLVWRLLGPDQDHDDIVQVVFCRLLQHVHKVREADKLRSWVRSVTVNSVYSELRKRGVRRLFFANESRKPEQFVDAPATLESRDLLARIYTELNRMPANERMAFSLRYIEGKQLSEVAELCGCSLATVKRRVARAEQRVEHLRQAFEELSQ